MSCHRCQRPLTKKAVECVECGVKYCKRVCYNGDYTSHQNSCIGSYTTCGDTCYPTMKAVIEELFRGGHIAYVRQALSDDNPYAYIEVELDDYVKGDPLSNDDVSIYAGKKEGYTPKPGEGCAAVTLLLKEKPISSFELYFKLHGRNRVR